LLYKIRFDIVDEKSFYMLKYFVTGLQLEEANQEYDRIELQERTNNTF